MENGLAVSVQLLLVGLLVGTVLVGNAVAVRYLPIDSVPPQLRPRIELSNRIRPWLGVVALLMTVTGLVLHVR